MQARKFKAIVHIGADEGRVDATNESWLQFLNDMLTKAGVTGVMLVVEPKSWEPPGGLVRDPRPFKRSRRRR